MATKRKEEKEIQEKPVETKENNNEIPVAPGIPQTGNKMLFVNEDIRQSLDILIQAAEIAQKNGCFSLQDAAYVSRAVALITPYCREVQEETNNEF